MVLGMNTAAIYNDWLGRVIDGKFTLLQWLGGSEWDDVFLTELPGDPERKVAIKLVPRDVEGAEACFDAWSAAAAFSHPHLMRILDTGRSQLNGNPLFYAVTEYAEENLAEILPERSLTPLEAREMLDPVLDALAYLHAKRFVHGHLKPSNILVVEDHLKLSVDGLHRTGEAAQSTPSPSIYDAPETGVEAMSPAADAWSLGVTLVEALTQQTPVWNRSTHADPVVPETIPEFFAWIAQGCLRTDPAKRFTLDEIRARLHPPPPSPPDSLAERAGESTPKRWQAPVVAALMVLIAVFAFLRLRSRENVPQAPPVASEQSAFTVAQPAAEATPSPQAAETPIPNGRTEKGAVMEQVPPDVLASATNTIHGRVESRVRATVGADGNVSDATLESPGPSKYFANKALQAAHSWKFKPALVNGQPVPRGWIVRFVFERTGTEITPIETNP